MGLARLGSKPSNPDAAAAYIQGALTARSSLRAIALGLQAYEFLGLKVPTPVASVAKDVLSNANGNFGDDVSTSFSLSVIFPFLLLR